ncbi:MAG: ABC transporter permease [Gemmatimonadaceae bacterium]|nr:ABC transporter permease [Gemmatimonadaceae bacterium]
MTPSPTLSPSDVFVAMMARDVRVMRRELPFFLLRTLMQPLLLMLVFGFLLPKMGNIPQAYVGTLFPGVLALSIALSSIQSVALPMSVSFSVSKEIEDRLLAPIPTRLVALELVVMGTLQGLVTALVVFPLGKLIIGTIPGLALADFAELGAVMLLSAAAFSAIGLFLGCAVAPQHIGLLFSFVVGPMIFFGCAYYPWRGLDVVPVMKYAVLLNPLVYVSEGMRGALTPGVPHMPLLVVTAALLVMLGIFWRIGLNAFMKRAVG